MDQHYELIDLESGNFVGDYETVDDAIATLRRAAQRYGRSAIERLSLVRVRGDDESLVALDDDLLALLESGSHGALQIREAITRSSAIVEGIITYERLLGYGYGKTPVESHLTPDVTTTNRLELACVA
jgi:hypothetical protein